MIKLCIELRILVFFCTILHLIVVLPRVAKSWQGIENPLLDYNPTEAQASSEDSQKISAHLRAKMENLKLRGITRQDARPTGTEILSNLLVRVNEDENIQVYIYVDATGAEARALLEAYGVEIEIFAEKFGIVQAWIPYSRIEELAKVAFVGRITTPNYGIPRIGSETTEGDIILRADELRALGVDGSGIKIGVISDGVDNRAAAQATNDLPSTITIQTFAGSGDEGTAMLEIIHDIAPGATLGFCGLPTRTSLEMIQCVNDLSGRFRADIIVDDFGFFSEPYFEDGLVAHAVAEALSRGVVYASSAGNSAQKHYQGPFVGTTDLGLGVTEHNFGNASGQTSDPTMDIIVSPGQSAIVLQWNDPFGGSANNYDLLVLNETETSLVGVSDNIQNGNDNPLESIAITNPGPFSARLKVAVTKISGADRLLKIFLIRSARIEEYAVAKGSVFGHAAVPGVLATGAIGADDPGNNTIESFSSRGPVEIFFPAREIRQKPDITAIDGVSVTGAGGFPSPFFGTSAAAPHVAGVAALLKSETTTASEISDALKNSAVDLGSPGTDNIYGAGRIDAFAAAQLLNQPPGGPCSEYQPGLDWCRDCGPCSEGQGDCDNDGECRSGLTCEQVPGIDTCRKVDCKLPLGTLDYCRDCGPCAEDEGDCDSDNECQNGLTCVQVPGSDTCQALAPACPHPVGSLDYCRDCGPCEEGQGDCDNDYECQSGLSCPQVPGIDTCQSESCTLPAGDLNFCRDCGPCAAGQGDCDNDGECQSGLACVQVVGIDTCQ